MANNFSNDSNCVSLWRMESGALGADSKGSDTLTENGSPTASGTCKEGSSSLEVSGTNQYLSRTDSALTSGFPLKSGTSNKTISVCGWFYPHAVGARQIFSKYAATTGGRSFAIVIVTATNQFGFRLGYNSGNSYEDIFIAQGTFTCTTNRWYHFGITYQDSDKSFRIRIWDDTAQQVYEYAGNTTNNIYLCTQDICVGTRSDGSEDFDGLIDELVVFKDVLTAAQIDAIRNGTYGGGVTYRYVDPDAAAGGNGTEQRLDTANCAYDSLSAWESARQRDITAATGDDSIEIAVCSSNLDAGGGTADDSLTIIDGWTTSATNYIQVEANSSHGGKWNANIYRLAYTMTTNTEVINIKEQYVRLVGLQSTVDMASSTYWLDIFVTNAQVAGGSDVRFDKCITKITNPGTGSANGFLNYDSDCTLTVTNCIGYDFTQSAGSTAAFRSNAGTTSFYNCTAHNSYRGFMQNAGTTTATNCGAASCTTGFSGTITQTTCSTASPTFVNEAGDDFHLQSSDTTWKGQGTDLSGTFTDDIDGQTRSAPWDIGADEYVSAGGVDTPITPRPTRAIQPLP